VYRAAGLEGISEGHPGQPPSPPQSRSPQEGCKIPCDQPLANQDNNSLLGHQDTSVAHGQPAVNRWPTRTPMAFFDTRTHRCLIVKRWPTTDQPGHQQPSWPPGYPAGSWSVCGQPLANRWPTRTPLALLATRAHCCLMVTLLANRWPPGPPGPSVQSSSPAAQPPSPPLCPGTPPGAAVCPT